MADDEQPRAKKPRVSKNKKKTGDSGSGQHLAEGDQEESGGAASSGATADSGSGQHLAAEDVASSGGGAAGEADSGTGQPTAGSGTWRTPRPTGGVNPWRRCRVCHELTYVNKWYWGSRSL